VLQADKESNEAAQEVMHVLRDSHVWLQEIAAEDGTTDIVAHVNSCMADERLPLQAKQNVVQARRLLRFCSAHVTLRAREGLCTVLIVPLVR
jgi:hypothetical protein